ncbi:MAG: bifunctional diaminohydroxyphosphoribosylaminopyrimidine deaminase/5-amino-6-(5-phosphoribosylamino)uracil reductase RibD [Actinomycetota bacterium]|nr:bifunctional diaminohydroxyphosphoribosylaminopyrimidine deaminase/5-amino-6-(5-phosphoribosylamino)uracil reductase RibD [Actinomycetota bacterium]
MDASLLDDERFMRRALELARVPARTTPNPRVGAVVVRDDMILGEGYHEGAGSPHAEIRALEGIDGRGATLYVNLEPCSHQGRTPPCVPAVIAAGIRRVVAAVEDPDERVAGRGFEGLRAGGVTVATGVGTAEATALNLAFIHHRRTGRPLLTLKLALTLDGRLAAEDGSSRWITGPEARARVHARRAEVDAILVGAGTVRSDDPSLTARDATTTRQPARVVVDASGSIPATARVFEAGAEVVVATTDAAAHERQMEWKEAGAEVLVLPADRDGRVDLEALLRALAQHEWLEIYCEGGGALAGNLLRGDHVDRLELYYGGVITGAGPAIGEVGAGTLTDAPRFELLGVERVEDDVAATFVRRPG